MNKSVFPSMNTFDAGTSYVVAAIERFGLPRRGRVLVGASGGKDSSFLALLLRHLGYEVSCLVVDMGYVNFEAAKVVENLRRLALPVEICNLRSDAQIGEFAPAEMGTLVANFRELDSETCLTPCGACSQSKRIALLRFALSKDFAFVALGHHRDDFLVTLLKDYFVKQYFDLHGAYEWEKFRNVISQLDIDEIALAQMCLEKRAGTMAVSLPLHSNVTLIRPMVFVPEAEIVSARDLLSIPTFSSGCMHSIFTNGGSPPTKRELVHECFQRRILHEPGLPDRLLPLMLSTLSADGRSMANPRQNRSTTLPGFA